jgi:Uncharacterized conserved protein (DUF2190)
MSDYSPPRPGGAVPFTSQASASITGGRLVSVSGDGTVAHSTAGDASIGVAAHDAASGAKVSVWPLANVTHEVPITASVAITAGNDIVPAANGLANKGTLATDAAAGTLVGIALNTKTGDGANGVSVRFIGRG